MTRMFDEDRDCGAMTRKGTPCVRAKGAGTDHPGSGYCSKHGGCTRSGVVHAAREEADAIASEMTLLAGRGAVITPGEGLLTMVNRSWAQVLFFEQRVAELELEQATTRPQRQSTVSLGKDAGYEIEDLMLEERLNLWAKELQGAMDRMAKYSKMALDAGVAQQQINMAKSQASSWAPMLKHVVDGLGLSADQLQLLPGLVRSALQSTLVIDA